MEQAIPLSDMEKKLGADLLECHRDIRNKTVRFGSFSCIIAVGYLMTYKGIFVALCALYLAGIIFYNKWQNSKLNRRYRAIENERLNKVLALLSGKDIRAEKKQMAFGYLVTDKSLKPVFLCNDGRYLYVFSNIYRRNLVALMGRNKMFLFPVIEKVLEEPLLTLPVAGQKAIEEPECHRDFLYRKQAELQDTTKFESYIYDCVLEDILTNKSKNPISTGPQLVKMHKEKLFRLAAGKSGEMLVMREQAAKRLRLPMEKENRKGE